MKKIIAVVLLTILIFHLSSCIVVNTTPEPENKYTKIALTLDNYRNYLAVDSYITNVEVTNYHEFYDGKTDKYTFYYDVSYTAVINVFPTRSNCTFENVGISIGDPLLYIRLDGYGYASSQTTLTDLGLPTPSVYHSFEIDFIFGYVYVYNN